MREIKFRAWFHEEKRMCEVFSFCKDFIKIVAHGIGDGVLKYEREKFDLMQYTGFGDKNKVDIYDGDIVQYDSWLTDRVAYMNFLRNVTNSDLRKIAVIGNIYENPELLTF